MKTPSFLLLILLSVSGAIAQKNEKAETQHWQISNSLNLSDTNGVATAYGKDRCNLVFINQSAPVETELQIPGAVVAPALYKGNILIFHTDQRTMDPDKEVHMVQVDAKTKTIVSDKIVYKNPGNNQLRIVICKDMEGNFNCLLIRITDYTGNLGHDYTDKKQRKIGASTALTALTLSDKMEPVLHPLSSASIGGVFLDAYSNQKGDIAIISETEGQLNIEKFSHEGQLQKKLSTPMEFRDMPIRASNTTWAGHFDPNADNTLVLSLQTYDRKGWHPSLSLFSFDFSSGKILTNGAIALNKDYFKQMKEDPELKKTKHFKQIEDLKADGVVFMGDKIVVCNQIQYDYSLPQPGSNLRFTSEGSIVSVYDRQLKLLHQFYIDGYYECFSDVGRGFSYCVRGNKLLLFGNELAGIGAYDDFYYLLDTDKFILEKKQLEWGSVLKKYPVNINTVFWFKDDILVNHLTENTLFGSQFDSYLVKTNY